MAEKYNVGLPLGTEETNSDAINKFISPKNAGLIPRSVRLEITQKGKLLDAPSKDLVEACLLLADISGFTALGEKLTKEHGDARGAEEFLLVVADGAESLFFLDIAFGASAVGAFF